jgi:microcystin-dependent protein
LSEYFIGQILLTGFVWNSNTFARCDGQVLPVAQNSALFSVLGTAYGGNGSSTFALPNMSFSTVVGAGASQDPAWQPQAYAMGQAGGGSDVQLSTANLPSHTHQWNGSSLQGTTNNPYGALHGGAYVQGGVSALELIYAPPNAPANLVTGQGQVGNSGGNQWHHNMQPSLALNYNIALAGDFPEA